jgi:hypothetical protein
MKRAAFIILFLSGILTVVSGFLSAAVGAEWAARMHVGIGILFVLTIVGHVRQSVRASRSAIRATER